MSLIRLPRPEGDAHSIVERLSCLTAGKEDLIKHISVSLMVISSSSSVSYTCGILCLMLNIIFPCSNQRGKGRAGRARTSRYNTIYTCTALHNLWCMFTYKLLSFFPQELEGTLISMHLRCANLFVLSSFVDVLHVLVEQTSLSM